MLDNSYIFFSMCFQEIAAYHKSGSGEAFKKGAASAGKPQAKKLKPAAAAQPEEDDDEEEDEEEEEEEEESD